jgi:hypothetical protein
LRATPSLFMTGECGFQVVKDGKDSAITTGNMQCYLARVAVQSHPKTRPAGLG